MKGTSIVEPAFDHRLTQLATQQTELRQALQHLAENVDAKLNTIINHIGWQMLELEAAQNQFTEILEELPGDAEVEIRHIGLDLFEANKKMVTMLQRPFAFKDAALKILVMTDKLRTVRPTPPDSVKTMTERVGNAVKNLQQKLTKDIDPLYRGRGLQLEIEVRSYREVPNVHGFSARRKVGHHWAHVATFYSFCRWNAAGNDLDWGGTQYRQVLGEMNDQSANDMRHIFEGAFAHLWNQNEEQVVWKNVIGRAATLVATSLAPAARATGPR